MKNYKLYSVKLLSYYPKVLFFNSYFDTCMFGEGYLTTGWAIPASYLKIAL